MANLKQGKILYSPFVLLEKHEIETISFLALLGKDIKILEPVRSKGVRTPDIAMDGICWEIKCPIGNGKHTLERILKKAYHQSQNIIFDLRKIKLPEQKAISQLKREFKIRTNLKHLLVITKNNVLLDIKK
jgi:hypothetical protein